MFASHCLFSRLSKNQVLLHLERSDWFCIIPCGRLRRRLRRPSLRASLFGACAPASERAASASLRPLAVHQYSFGSQSCRIRRVPAQSARLSAAKDAAFVTLMSSRRILRSVASGPVRRVAAPAGCRSIHGAILRRRIRLLVSLASRLVNPRTASPRLTPPAAPNLHRSRTQGLAPSA